MLGGARLVPARPLSEERDRPIRVMIVDDSIVARAVLARTLDAEPDFVVAAQANSGVAALDMLEQARVDLILLDIEMPGMSGLEALPRLIEAGHGARVLIVSAAAGEGATATINALRLGAADTLLKPAAGSLVSGEFALSLVERLRRIARDETPRRPPPEPTPAAPGPRLGIVDCLAIGASTGGVHALAEFFAALPRDFPAPILVTQHLPKPFMPYFAGQLREMAGRPAKIAASGMPIQSHTVLLAPGDAHIGLAEINGAVHVRLLRKPSVSGCMPSVDPMFTAVAATYGAGGLGVVLSGMGRDGLVGAGSLAAAGAKICVQDAGSSVVWGMPGVVADAGLAAIVAPPRALAEQIGRGDARARSAAWI